MDVLEVIGGSLMFIVFWGGLIWLFIKFMKRSWRKARTSPLTNRIVATSEARSTDLQVRTALPAGELVERIATAVPVRPATTFKNGLELQSKSDMGLIYRSVTYVGGTSWRLRIDIADGNTTALHAYITDMQTVSNSIGTTMTTSSQEAISIFDTIRQVVQNADANAQVHG